MDPFLSLTGAWWRSITWEAKEKQAKVGGMSDKVAKVKLVPFCMTSLMLFPTQVCLNPSCPQCNSASVGVVWCMIEVTLTLHFGVFSGV